jgi:hypothetical protein
MFNMMLSYYASSRARASNLTIPILSLPCAFLSFVVTVVHAGGYGMDGVQIKMQGAGDADAPADAAQQPIAVAAPQLIPISQPTQPPAQMQQPGMPRADAAGRFYYQRL